MSLDPTLAPLIESYLDPADRDLLTLVLRALGADAAQRLGPLAETADKNPPVLEQFDREGERVDAISYHDSYRELSRAAYEEYGLSALSHRGLHGWDDVPPQLVKYVLSYVFVQAEFGLACPVSMTDAAALLFHFLDRDPPQNKTRRGPASRCLPDYLPSVKHLTNGKEPDYHV